MTEDEKMALLDEVTKQADCYDFLHDNKLFPEGYNTEIGITGGTLSGG